MVKRMFDIFFSSIGLILTLPILLVIGVLIKIESSGPVFFRQERVGRYGKVFRIHKFRTMVVNAEGIGKQITIGDDPRITKLGRFLRRTKLDELPQLLDVIIGNMSIVGPRPEVPRYIAYYPSEVRDAVLSVRPGITDRASIEFKDENLLLGKSDNPETTYIEEILPIKQKYYMDYVSNNNLYLDLKIIINTIKEIVIR